MVERILFGRGTEDMKMVPASELEKAHAEAAVLREAVKEAILVSEDWIGGPLPYFERVKRALTTNAGADMLEELRRLRGEGIKAFDYWKRLSGEAEKERDANRESKGHFQALWVERGQEIELREKERDALKAEVERLKAVNEANYRDWQAEGKLADRLTRERDLAHAAGFNAGLEAAGRTVIGLMVVGRAWTEEQAAAAMILQDACEAIRAIPRLSKPSKAACTCGHGAFNHRARGVCIVTNCPCEWDGKS